MDMESVSLKLHIFEQRKKQMTPKIFEGKRMINILPQPRKMFEFVARLGYFRITTSSCDFLAQNRELISQI